MAEEATNKSGDRREQLARALDQARQAMATKGLCIGTISIQMPFIMMLMALGQLQLASRHPLNRGNSAAAGRALAFGLEDAIVTHVPELKPLIDAGWDPACDVSAEDGWVDELLEDGWVDELLAAAMPARPVN